MVAFAAPTVLRELRQQSLRFLLRQPSPNHLFRYLVLAIKLVAFGIVAGTACPQIIANWI